MLARKVWSLIVVACALAGCKGDRCREAVPGFQIDLILPPGVDGGRVATLSVEIDAAGLRKEQTLQAASLLGDGRTSIAVDVGSAGASGFSVSVSVQARDAQGAVLAQGRASFQAGGDSCNFFSLGLLASSDGGLDGPRSDAPAEGTHAADSSVGCGGVAPGICVPDKKLVCGPDGKLHIDCVKCGCPVGSCSSGRCIVTLSPTADAHTRKSAPSQNFGLEQVLVLTKTPMFEQAHVYLNFPFSAIPPVASIVSARLKLHGVGWQGKPVVTKVTIIRDPWSETTITASSAPGPLASPALSTTIGFGWNEIDVTAHATAWLAAPVVVYGLRLECLDPATPLGCSDAGICGYLVTMASRESPNATQRPVLEVVYQ